jgi:CHAT domain-containing protein
MKKKHLIHLLVIFIGTCLLTFLLGNLASQSLPIYEKELPATSQNAQENSSYWQEEILKMDERCTKKYETFFGQNFTDLSLTSKQIVDQLKDLKQQTKKNPAAIWIWSYPDRLDVMMITSENKPIGKSIKEADADHLNPVITELMEQVTEPIAIPFGIRNSTSYLSPSQKLYQWMIQPLESQLKAEKIDTLIICVGPRLRTLPLSALHNGNNFLVEDYSIAMVPSFSLTNLKPSQKNGETMRILAMGSSSFEFLSPLPGVALEIDNITPFPWDGLKMTENQFTLENLKSQREKFPFDIIHLATHAQFQPGEPKDSYIQLSDHQLTLAEVGELNWNNPPVALLVLSACETAIGDQNAELGFAGLAVQSGVRSALGSYWPVSDAGTLALMTEFYQHLKDYQDKYNVLFKAEALRDTQISMIQNKVYVTKGLLRRSTRGDLSLPSELLTDGDDNLSHPFYWGAFSLIGSPW